MPTRFDRDTAVSRVDSELFEARIDRGWWVNNGPNGGYVAAIILRALEVAVAAPDRPPRSLTVQYLSAPTEGPITIRTQIERMGMAMTSCSARVYQDERLVAMAMAAFSTIRHVGPEFCDLTPPDAPDPQVVPRMVVAESGPPVRRRWDMRWTIGQPPKLGVPPSGEALAGGWIRLDEPEVLGAPAVAAVMDAWTPPIFVRAREPLMLPTVVLTVHFRTSLPLADAKPDDFLLAIFRTNAATEGFVEEDGEVWSADGRLVAQSRQLAVATPRPG